MPKIATLMHVSLPHDARFAAGAGTGHVVAVSSDGDASLISPDFKTITSFKVQPESEGVAISQDASLLAVAAADGITLLSIPTFEKVHRLNDAFLTCLFVGEKLFWTCARFTDETVILEAWERGSWEKIARVKVADPYGQSSFSLFAHPDPQSVVLWAAGGQDGQCLFWATLDGAEIKVTHFDAIDESGVPSFSPRGDEFLVTSEYELQRYTYPKGTLKGSITELGGDEDEEDPIGYFVAYVNANQALLTSMNGKVFLVDVGKMSVVDEVDIPDVGGAELLDYVFQLPKGKAGLVYRERRRGAKATGHIRVLGRSS
jgi:hypothetical protein